METPEEQLFSFGERTRETGAATAGGNEEEERCGARMELSGASFSSCPSSRSLISCCPPSAAAARETFRMEPRHEQQRQSSTTWPPPAAAAASATGGARAGEAAAAGRGGAAGGGEPGGSTTGGAARLLQTADASRSSSSSSPLPLSAATAVPPNSVSPPAPAAASSASVSAASAVAAPAHTRTKTERLFKKVSSAGGALRFRASLTPFRGADRRRKLRHGGGRSGVSGSPSVFSGRLLSRSRLPSWLLRRSVDPTAAAADAAAAAEAAAAADAEEAAAQRAADEEAESEDRGGEEEEGRIKCWKPLLKLLELLFPTPEPLVWQGCLFLACAMATLVGLGDGTSATLKEYFLGILQSTWTPGQKTQVSTPPPVILREISTRTVLLQGSLAYCYVLLINVAFWIGFMIFRIVLIIGLLNGVCYDMHTATAFTATIDPHIIYVLWSICCYAVWLNNSDRTAWVLIPKSGEVKEETIVPLVYFRWFGKDLFFPSSSLEFIYVSNLTVIIVACRQLLLSAINFFFELGFLMNMNGPLLAYINKYSKMRNFNVKWCEWVARVPVEEIAAEDAEERADLRSADGSVAGMQSGCFLPPGAAKKHFSSSSFFAPEPPAAAALPPHSVPAVAPAAPDNGWGRPAAAAAVSAGQRGGRGRIRASSSSGRAQQQQLALLRVRGEAAAEREVAARLRRGPQLLSRVDAAQAQLSPRSGGDSRQRRRRLLKRSTLILETEEDRTARFRLRHSITRENIRAEFSGYKLPKQLHRTFFERSRASKMRNWLLIHYVIDYPAALFLRGQRVALNSKTAAAEAAERLFDEVVSAQLFEENRRPAGDHVGTRDGGNEEAAVEFVPSRRKRRSSSYSALLDTAGMRPPATSADLTAAAAAPAPAVVAPAAAAAPASAAAGAAPLTTSAAPAAAATAAAAAEDRGRGVAAPAGGKRTGAAGEPAGTTVGRLQEQRETEGEEEEEEEGQEEEEEEASHSYCNGRGEDESAENGQQQKQQRQRPVPLPPQPKPGGEEQAAAAAETAAAASCGPSHSFAAAAPAPSPSGPSSHTGTPPASAAAAAPATGAEQPHPAREDSTWRQQQQRLQRFADSEENLLPPPGDFEFRVLDPQTARLPIRLRTQHIDTRTPFSIAIRPAASDVQEVLQDSRRSEEEKKFERQQQLQQLQQLQQQHEDEETEEERAGERTKKRQQHDVQQLRSAVPFSRDVLHQHGCYRAEGRDDGLRSCCAWGSVASVGEATAAAARGRRRGRTTAATAADAAAAAAASAKDGEESLGQLQLVAVHRSAEEDVEEPAARGGWTWRDCGASTCQRIYRGVRTPRAAAEGSAASCQEVEEEEEQTTLAPAFRNGKREAAAGALGGTAAAGAAAETADEGEKEEEEEGQRSITGGGLRRWKLTQRKAGFILEQSRKKVNSFLHAVLYELQQHEETVPRLLHARSRLQCDSNSSSSSGLESDGAGAALRASTCKRLDSSNNSLKRTGSSSRKRLRSSSSNRFTGSRRSTGKQSSRSGRVFHRNSSSTKRIGSGSSTSSSEGVGCSRVRRGTGTRRSNSRRRSGGRRSVNSSSSRSRTNSHSCSRSSSRQSTRNRRRSSEYSSSSRSKSRGTFQGSEYSRGKRCLRSNRRSRSDVSDSCCSSGEGAGAKRRGCIRSRQQQQQHSRKEGPVFSCGSKEQRNKHQNRSSTSNPSEGSEHSSSSSSEVLGMYYKDRKLRNKEEGSSSNKRGSSSSRSSRSSSSSTSGSGSRRRRRSRSRSSCTSVSNRSRSRRKGSGRLLSMYGQRGGGRCSNRGQDYCRCSSSRSNSSSKEAGGSSSRCSSTLSRRSSRSDTPLRGSTNARFSLTEKKHKNERGNKHRSDASKAICASSKQYTSSSCGRRKQRKSSSSWRRKHCTGSSSNSSRQQCRSNSSSRGQQRKSGTRSNSRKHCTSRKQRSSCHCSVKKDRETSSLLSSCGGNSGMGDICVGCSSQNTSTSSISSNSNSEGSISSNRSSKDGSSSSKSSWTWSGRHSSGSSSGGAAGKGRSSRNRSSYVTGSDFYSTRAAAPPERLSAAMLRTQAGQHQGQLMNEKPQQQSEQHQQQFEQQQRQYEQQQHQQFEQPQQHDEQQQQYEQQQHQQFEQDQLQYGNQQQSDEQEGREETPGQQQPGGIRLVRTSEAAQLPSLQHMFVDSSFSSFSPAAGESHLFSAPAAAASAGAAFYSAAADAVGRSAATAAGSSVCILPQPHELHHNRWVAAAELPATAGILAAAMPTAATPTAAAGLGEQTAGAAAGESGGEEGMLAAAAAYAEAASHETASESDLSAATAPARFEEAYIAAAAQRGLSRKRFSCAAVCNLPRPTEESMVTAAAGRREATAGGEAGVEGEVEGRGEVATAREAAAERAAGGEAAAEGKESKSLVEGVVAAGQFLLSPTVAPLGTAALPLEDRIPGSSLPSAAVASSSPPREAPPSGIAQEPARIYATSAAAPHAAAPPAAATAATGPAAGAAAAPGAAAAFPAEAAASPAGGGGGAAAAGGGVVRTFLSPEDVLEAEDEELEEEEATLLQRQRRPRGKTTFVEGSVLRAAGGRGAGEENGAAEGTGGKDTEEKPIEREYLALFLQPDELDELLAEVDFAGQGKVSKDMFRRFVVSLYTSRKKLLKSLKNQASIARTVKHMCSVIMWGFALFAFLLVLGININTVLVSGAAFLSAAVVALSYIYQNFISAVIFIAVSSPFNVGDRVRVDGGDILYVRKIRTYTTEFETVHGRPVIYNNATLFTRVITNETRSKNSSFEISLQLDTKTSQSSLKLLEATLRRYVEKRALDFVKNSFAMYVVSISPGQYVQVSFWMTCVEGWGNYVKVLQMRTQVLLYVTRQLNRLGVSFTLPVQPLEFPSTPLYLQSVSPAPASSSSPSLPLPHGTPFCSSLAQHRVSPGPAAAAAEGAAAAAAANPAAAFPTGLGGGGSSMCASLGCSGSSNHDACYPVPCAASLADSLHPRVVSAAAASQQVFNSVTTHAAALRRRVSPCVSSPFPHALRDLQRPQQHPQLQQLEAQLWWWHQPQTQQQFLRGTHRKQPKKKTQQHYQQEHQLQQLQQYSRQQQQPCWRRGAWAVDLGRWQQGQREESQQLLLSHQFQQQEQLQGMEDTTPAAAADADLTDFWLLQQRRAYQGKYMSSSSSGSKRKGKGRTQHKFRNSSSYSVLYEPLQQHQQRRKRRKQKQQQQRRKEILQQQRQSEQRQPPETTSWRPFTRTKEERSLLFTRAYFPYHHPSSSLSDGSYSAGSSNSSGEDSSSRWRSREGSRTSVATSRSNSSNSRGWRRRRKEKRWGSASSSDARRKKCGIEPPSISSRSVAPLTSRNGSRRIADDEGSTCRYDFEYPYASGLITSAGGEEEETEISSMQRNCWAHCERRSSSFLSEASAAAAASRCRRSTAGAAPPRDAAAGSIATATLRKRKVAAATPCWDVDSAAAGGFCFSAAVGRMVAIGGAADLKEETEGEKEGCITTAAPGGAAPQLLRRRKPAAAQR